MIKSKKNSQTSKKKKNKSKWEPIPGEVFSDPSNGYIYPALWKPIRISHVEGLSKKQVELISNAAKGIDISDFAVLKNIRGGFHLFFKEKLNKSKQKKLVERINKLSIRETYK